MSSYEHIDPRNVGERQSRLILELLKQEEPQKIYYFSQLLQVSESTINSDLNEVDKWFSQNRVHLVRKPGLGVYLQYKEENYRKSYMRYVYQGMQESFSTLYKLVPSEMVEDVIDIVGEIQHKKLDDMADFSHTGLIIFLSISVQRILQGKCISESVKITEAEKESDDYSFA